MPSQLLRGSAAEATTHLSLALNGTVPSNAIYSSYTAEFTRVGEFALANSFAAAYSNDTNAALATRVLGNLGVTATSIGASSYATLVAAVETAFAAYPAARGQVALNLARLLSGLESDATYGAAATSFNNNAATAFTYSSNPANTASTTLTALNAPVDRTVTLTTGVDSVAGGSGSETILGVVDSTTATNNTFSVADVINGGAGNDTLQITVQNIAVATTYTPTQLTNVESVRVINVDPTPDAVTLNLNSTSGVTAVEANSSSAGVTFDNLTNGLVALTATSNTGAVNFNVKAASLTGAADTVNLTLNSNTGNVLVNTDGAGFEAASITLLGSNGTGASNVIGAGATITTLTVGGSGTHTFAAADLTAVKTLNASTNSGGIGYTATALNATLTGGSGNDTLAGGAGNDVISGGAGNDSITAGAGNDSVDAGAGDDTVVVSAVTREDTILGGDGAADTLSIAAAITYTASTSTDEAVNVKGFERLTTTTAATQNMLGLNANNTIDTFVVGHGSGTTVLQNVVGLTTVLARTTGGNLTLGLKTNGTADTLAVTMGNATAATGSSNILNATQFETLNVSSTGGTNALTLGTANAGDGVTAGTASTATQLTTLTVTGSKDLTVTGSSVDTALRTINAADFTGSTLRLTGFTSTTAGSAMTVNATGAYNATVTTGGGADSITGGSGNDSLTGNDGADTITGGLGNDTLVGGSGNNVLSGGAGNDSITGTTGADSADGGDGDDTISVSDGLNTVIGAAGNDTITTGVDADSVSGGDGNDTITTSLGNDTVDAGAGDDSINAGAGSDSVTAGAGNDTIDASTGDDTVLGGDGNDVITIASLTNGDSVDGGAGTDTLTITTIASDATPSGITNIEDFRVTTLGGTTASVTLDLTNVTGITGLRTTIAQNDGTALTVKALPSTMTSLTLTDGGVGTTDTLTLAYRSGPSSLTVTPVGNVVGATSITSLNAPLTISGRTNQNLANDADVLYTGAAAQVNKFGALTTDATTITINTQALPTTVAGQELEIGTITDNVLTSLKVSGATNADVTVGATTTTAAEFASLTLESGANATTTFGGLTANSATAVSVALNQGNAGTLSLGANLSATKAAVTVTGTQGDQVSGGTTRTIIGASIASSNITVGAGATITLPTLEVGATGTTATIGGVTITSGAGSVVTQTIGSSVTPTTIGTITASGAGRVDVTIGATSAATTSTGASTQGTLTAAAGMTSPLSSFRVAGGNAVAQLSIVGGAGADSLVGGTLADFITGGVGADTLTGGAGQDVFIFSVGESDAVYGGAGASSGQDTITANSTNTTEQLLRFNITSADTTWDMDHILVGTANGAVTSTSGGANAGNTGGFANTTVLVQAGTAVAANTASTDNFDIVINVNTALTAAEARAMSQINLTGTVSADTLTTGANNDTINGGAGADTITGGAGADVINVGSSTTDVDRVVQAAVGDSGTFAAPATNTIATTTFDVISGMTASDVLRLAQYTSFGTAADNVAASTLGTIATTLVGLTVGANSIGFVRGTYTAPVVTNGVVTTAGSFVGSATGSDLMVVYDGNATLATTALEAVVLVGAGANTVAASGAGLLTLGG